MNPYGLSLRQPQPNDLVGSTLAIAALGTAFEASYSWRLMHDDNVLTEGFFTAGSMGVLTPFVHETAVEGVSHRGPATFELAGDDPSEGEGVPDLVRVPLVIVPGAQGHVPYQVVKGDTLSKIVQEHKDWGGLVTVDNIAAASGLSDPNKIHPGQILRIPV
jgi:nucleoid-associated protein YgaU